MEIRNFNTNEINELIKTRRSIYPPVYKNEVVDDEIIKKNAGKCQLGTHS
jgi:hypothetical protein